MVRKHHILMATWDWWQWLRTHFLCMMGKLHRVSVCECVCVCVCVSQEADSFFLILYDYMYKSNTQSKICPLATLQTASCFFTTT